MLIIALVLAVIGLVSLVTAVVTSNEFVAWVCIGASAVGVILLIVDAIREHQHDVVDDSASEVGVGDEPADPVDITTQESEVDAESDVDAESEVDPQSEVDLVDYPDLDDPDHPGSEDPQPEALEDESAVEPVVDIETSEILDVVDGENDVVAEPVIDDSPESEEPHHGQLDDAGERVEPDAQLEPEAEASIDQATARWLSST